MAQALLPHPQLADLLGERHRIIANDWQAAGLDSLIGQLLRRAGKLLEQLEFTPGALREDLAGPRTATAYLFSASELIDHAADLIADSAKLVHDNERRWRVFHDRVAHSPRSRACRNHHRRCTRRRGTHPELISGRWDRPAQRQRSAQHTLPVPAPRSRRRSPWRGSRYSRWVGVRPVMGSFRFGGDDSEELRIAPRRPASEATPRGSSATRSSRSRSLPTAAAAVSAGMGLAPWAHVSATRPRRTEDRQAPLHRGDGLEVRPGNPRGSHLLGLGSEHRLGSEHSSPSGDASPDRPGVVHTPAALPLGGRELRSGGRVPTPASLEVAPSHVDPGLGRSPLRYGPERLRPQSAVRVIESTGLLPR